MNTLYCLLLFMVRNKDETSIPLRKSTRERLGKFGNKNESWDKLLNRLMDEAYKVPLLETKNVKLMSENENLNKQIFEINSDLINVKMGRSTLKEFKENMKRVGNVKCAIKLDDIKTTNYNEE